MQGERKQKLHQVLGTAGNLKVRMIIFLGDFNSKTSSYVFRHPSHNFNKSRPVHSKQHPRKTQLHSQMYSIHNHHNFNKTKYLLNNNNNNNIHSKLSFLNNHNLSNHHKVFKESLDQINLEGPPRHKPQLYP